MIKLVDFADFCFHNKIKEIKVKDAYGMKITCMSPCNRKHMEQEWGSDILDCEVLIASFMDETVFVEIDTVLNTLNSNYLE